MRLFTFLSAIAPIAGAFTTAIGNVEARDANEKDGKVIDGICVPGVGALYPDGICQCPPLSQSNLATRRHHAAKTDIFDTISLEILMLFVLRVMNVMNCA